jgi:transposase
MRGADITQEPLFTTIKLDELVPHDHPLRSIKILFDQALTHIDWKLSLIYSERGRESIPPERLLRALLLQILFSIRSERQLVEQIQYNMLYRWFVGLSIDDPVWDHSTFSVNRDRLIHHNVSTELLAEVVASAQKQKLLSNDHFSVDGTLIQAWASQKSFRRSTRMTIRIRMKGLPDAIRKRIFVVPNAAMIRMNRPPIAMRGCSKSPKDKKPGYPSWGIRSWKTGMV